MILLYKCMRNVYYKNYILKISVFLLLLLLPECFKLAILLLSMGFHSAWKEKSLYNLENETQEKMLPNILIIDVGYKMDQPKH